MMPIKHDDYVKILEHIKKKLQSHTAATNVGELKAYLTGYIDGQLGYVYTLEEKK